MKNKKGLSGVVTVLILVLLATVAVGVVWFAVQGLVDQGTENIDISSRCLDSGIKITKASCAGAVCSATVSRESGKEEFTGIKLVFADADGENNYIQDVSGNIAPLSLTTESDVDTGLANPSKVEAVVYFTDEAGQERLCDQRASFTL